MKLALLGTSTFAFLFTGQPDVAAWLLMYALGLLLLLTTLVLTVKGPQAILRTPVPVMCSPAWWARREPRDSF